MTNSELIAALRSADKDIDTIQANGGLYSGEGYSGAQTTEEYEIALEKAQKLFTELEKRGIDPFN